MVRDNRASPSTFQRENPDGTVEQLQRATEYAMGKYGEIIPDNVCRRLPANSDISWDIHLFPGGLSSGAPGTVIEDNVVELGLWLQPADYQYEYEQDLRLYGFEEGPTEMLIPPNGKLMTQATGQEKVEIYPESETKFFLKVADAQLTFARNEQGKVTHLTLHQNGNDMKAPRIE